MAADFITTEEGLIRTTGLIPSGGDFTMCWWAYLPAVPAPATWITLFVRDSAVDNGIWYGYGSTGNLEGDIYGGSGPTTDALGTGWRFLTYTYEHATGEHNMYADAVLAMTDTYIMNAADPMVREMIGTYGDGLTSVWDPSKAAYLKQWERLLTTDEIEDQMLKRAPVSVVDLWLETPLESDLLDYSGNGRDWSQEDGTITFAAGPSGVATGDSAIWAMDVGGATDDNPTEGIDDDGTDYVASLVTRPFAPAHVINQFGVTAGALVARAAEGVEVEVSLLRNYGATEKVAEVDLSPEASEENVIKRIDNLSMKELRIVQYKFADVDTPAGRWDLSQFAVRQSAHEKGT